MQADRALAGGGAEAVSRFRRRESCLTRFAASRARRLLQISAQMYFQSGTARHAAARRLIDSLPTRENAIYGTAIRRTARFRRARKTRFPLDFDCLQTPHKPGVISAS